MKREEQILFYNFNDEGMLSLAQKTLHRMNIKTRVLKSGDWREKIGYLLGMPGFKASSNDESDDVFSFPHELMIIQNIQKKRLTTVLESLRDAGVPHIAFKSVVTPYNILWPLRRLCETMQKEHGAVAEIAARKSQDAES